MSGMLSSSSYIISTFRDASLALTPTKGSHSVKKNFNLVQHRILQHVNDILLGLEQENGAVAEVEVEEVLRL